MAPETIVADKNRLLPGHCTRSILFYAIVTKDYRDGLFELQTAFKRLPILKEHDQAITILEPYA
jgi:hypothetical protein